MASPQPLEDVVEYRYRSEGPHRKRLLIFFLPGNPGVVEYYRDFLSDLHKNLTNNNSATEPSARKDSLQDRVSSITTYGHSHAGFELRTGWPGPHDLTPPSCMSRGPPFDLHQQIEGVKVRLTDAVRHYNDGVDGDAEQLKVVLVGHSVGSYMLMEVVDWWQKEVFGKKAGAGMGKWEVVGGVCLFPTVVDLEKSPRGKVMRWVLAIPGLQWAAWLLAAFLVAYISPIHYWNWPAALTPGDKPSRTSVETTEAFIKSPTGVRQTIYLAADEMHQIRHDKWHPSHVWGAQDPTVDVTKTSVKASAATPRTKLFFYWGRDDYWVDNTSRNRLIEKRARRVDNETHAGRPTMVIDQHSMDHCFSLEREHGRIVAGQVAEWVREVVG
ncbi:hypothetical protein PRZ48_007016 [Zasmidium cellare]|uniref:Lipid droplet-associated hydrolase n=1 Tax=Zasmidium cellare TaxID=395010 RepID=A0ABR0EIK0_ZASCE|nr:hypothetical protein PRZ48_007016 [Zasmidium cellare]